MMPVPLARALSARIIQGRRAYPEWWLIALAVSCWLWLIAPNLARDLPNTPIATHSSPHIVNPSFGMAMLNWLLMCGAMMAPLAIPGFRHVVFSTFRFRQRRSGLIFAGAFGMLWMLFGLIAVIFWKESGVFDDRQWATLTLALALMTAAAWQLTAAKRRALNTCHLAIPLPAFGRQADLSCARFGLLQSWRCLGSCWALMLAMTLDGGLFWMIGISLIVCLERSSRSRSLVRQSSAIALGLLAFLVLIQNLS
jgi:predicted metal-binding membrane protein